MLFPRKVWHCPHDVNHLPSWPNFLKCLHISFGMEAELQLMDSQSSRSIGLNNNLSDFLSVNRNFLCMAPRLSCVGSPQREKLYLHSHCFNTSWALWFLSCRASVSRDVSVPPLVKHLCFDLRSLSSVSDSQRGTVSVCVGTRVWCSCANPMQMSSLHFSWLLEGSTQRMIFFIISRIGLDEIDIFIKKMSTFWMKSFF